MILMKYLSVSSDYMSLSIIKLFLSALVLIIYIYYKKIDIHTNIIKNMIIGFFMFYLNTILTMCGLKYVEGSSLAFINSLSGCIMIVLSYVFLKKKIYINAYIYIFSVFLSFLISIEFNLYNLNLGALFMILGLFSYNFGYVLYDLLNLNKSLYCLFVQLLASISYMFIHMIIMNEHIVYSLSIIELLLLVIISSIGFIYIQCIYLKSIDSIGKIMTSHIFSFVPVFVFILSLVFFDNIGKLHLFISIIVLLIANINYL